MKKATTYFLMLLVIIPVFFGFLTDEREIFGQTEKTKARETPNPNIAKPVAGTSKSQSSNSIGEVTTSLRYALLIGNSAYPGDMHLSNTVNDTKLIAKSLRSINFNVTEKTNLTLLEMRAAVEDFSRKLPNGAVAMFYYAGHGLQVSGKNFLLPIDFKGINNESELLATQLDLDNIVTSISQKSSLSIIVLDACRNNNLELALSFKTEQGLTVPKQNSDGIYIAFSTAPGKTAYDGFDSNSPYAKALARNLQLRPGRLEDIFMKTRLDVRNQTAAYQQGEQVPWESVSLSKIFYLTPDKLRGSGSSLLQGQAVDSILVKPALPFGISSLLSYSFSSPLLDKRGSRLDLINRTAAYFIENFSSANVEMVSIPGGTFQMGSGPDEVEKAYEDALKSNDEADRLLITAEMPRRSVNVPGFFISKYEITQKQWRSVMGDLPEIPAELLGEDKPIVNITWQEANKFCNVLSLATHRNYRLPSEAEWEYAARGGTETSFTFGENINSDYVNFFAYVPFDEGIKGEFRNRTTPVGQLKAANKFGIYDIEGNVSEWCADYWHWDYNGAPNDGSAWNEPAPRESDDQEDPALYRVIRGCSYQAVGNDCRSAHRRAKPADGEVRLEDLGFRVVLGK